MSEPIKESGPQQIAYARRGSLKLLARLQAEHDCNISPPKNWKRRAAPQPVSEVLKPMERKPWFFIVTELPETNYPSVASIQAACASHYGVTRHDILSARRTANVVRPRQVGMYLAKIMTVRSYPDIGRRFGGRDHTTAIHAYRKIDRLLKVDGDLADDVAAIKTSIGRGTHA